MAVLCISYSLSERGRFLGWGVGGRGGAGSCHGKVVFELEGLEHSRKLQCFTCLPGFCHASPVSSLSFHLACEMQAMADLLTVGMWARS